MVGYSATGQPVAQAGFGLGFRAVGRKGLWAPVPDEYTPGECWIAVFFNRVARALAVNAPGVDLVVPIGAYVDSVVDHLDSAYLKLQIGLERFALDLLGSHRQPLVHDRDQWKRWVHSLHSTIATHAIDGTAAGILTAKMIGAREPTTGKTVEAVLARHGVRAGKRVIAEIKERGFVAHRFTMRKRSKRRNLDADVRRCDLLRTLVTALVAVHTGYDGPIVGWDRHGDGWPKAAQWWPEPHSATLAEANQWFICGTYPK
jgi:hypothetical protein